MTHLDVDYTHSTEIESVPLKVVIEKAMMFAVSKDKYGRELETDIELVEGSSERCYENSTRVIEYICNNFHGYFKKMFLVNSHVERLNKFAGDWDSHACFVLVGNDNRYYVGSPANHQVNMPNDSNRLKDFFEGDTLSEAMVELIKRDGGDWGEFGLIEGMPYQEPLVDEDKHLHSLAVYSYYGGDDWSYDFHIM